jgi:hypothetical protein
MARGSSVHFCYPLRTWLAHCLLCLPLRRSISSVVTCCCTFSYHGLSHSFLIHLVTDVPFKTSSHLHSFTLLPSRSAFYNFCHFQQTRLYWAKSVPTKPFFTTAFQYAFLCLDMRYISLRHMSFILNLSSTPPFILNPQSTPPGYGSYYGFIHPSSERG